MILDFKLHSKEGLKVIKCPGKLLRLSAFYVHVGWLKKNFAFSSQIINTIVRFVLQGIFIKDSNSLAYYNVTPASIVQLQLKERGGRKKWLNQTGVPLILFN